MIAQNYLFDYSLLGLILSCNDSNPGIIDFGDGDGTYGDRVVQICWQDDIRANFKYAVGIEEPRRNISNPEELKGVVRPTKHTFTGHLGFNFKNNSHIQLGLDMFQHHWQGGETVPKEVKVGYGLNLTSRIIFDKDNTNSLLFGVSTGLASTYRVLFLEFEPSNEIISENGLELLNTDQAYLGFNLYWSKSLDSTIAGYYGELDYVDIKPGLTSHRGGTTHDNLICFFYKYVATGIEFIHEIYCVKDGPEESASRFQVMVRFINP